MSSTTPSTPHALSLETRPSRSASISTSSTSLPSPTFSQPEDYLSPQFQSAADSPPPSMSASLGKLEDASNGGARSGTSVGIDELGAYVRAKNGQKRHSISGGSSLGYPHQVTNPNHSVSKAPAANKKKARFELQHVVRPLTVNTLASLSSSAPTTSPISIPANFLSHQRNPSTVCLPCSKCAVLLPLPVSSSVPLHEDPVCERCLDQAYAVKPILTSSSVPARSSAHLIMTSSLAPASTLAGWESEDEDYEFVDPPAQEQRPQVLDQQQTWSKRTEQHHQQHHQFSGTGSHTWSLEEEFSFLDTSFAVDSDPMLDSMDDVPPRVTLAGWGGPFFKNMPMPPGKKFGASALQEPSYPSPMLGGGGGPPPGPAPSFPAPHHNHRSYTSPTSSSSSSTSSLSSFSPNSAMPSPLTSSFNHDSHGLPTPLSESSQFNIAHPNSKGLLLGLANLQPSLARQQALPVSSSPHHAFAAAAQARHPIRPFLNGSLAAAIPAGADGLDYLVGAPLSPIFPGGGVVGPAASSVGMKRTGSGRSSLFKWDAGGEGEPMQVEMEEGLVSVA